MQKWVDKFALFGLCLLALSLTEVSWQSVLIVLGAVTVSSLNSYFENNIPPVMCAVYAAACLFVPECTVFLPLIIYDCAGFNRLFFRFCWCAALPVCLFLEGWQVSAVIVLSSGAAFLLQYRTSAGLKARSELFRLNDDAKERTVRLERKNQELMEKQDYEVRLATLAERNRIAREIHDNVGHMLTRSILQLTALRVTRGNTDGLDAIKDTLSDAMDSIRNSVHNLHDESIDLKLQLENMLNGFTFCPVKLRYDAGELPVKIRTCFVSVAREALSNIARHSGATEAFVTVTEHPAFCRLTINQRGNVTLHPNAPAGAGRGMGLQNMADRVEALGGVFRVEKDKGFKIFITVPKEVKP